MSTRLHHYFQQRDALVIETYSPEQLNALHQEADTLATEERMAALEQRMLEGDIEEVHSTIATLESLQGCLAAVQNHPERTALLAIQSAVSLQQERLGLVCESLAMESLSDADLTASLEAGIWDTIKRLWDALIAMCKRLVQYIVDLFTGAAAKQKAYAAEVEAGRKEFEESLRQYVAEHGDKPAMEYFNDLSGVFDAGVLVSASAAVKDALNVAPREGRIDLKGLLSDGICDTNTLSRLKERLFRGVQLLERFQQATQAELEAAIQALTEELSTAPLHGFRGPKVEGKAVHYHSKWLHPLGGVMMVVTPLEGAAQATGHSWAANAGFTQVVNSITVSPYRNAPLEDKEGAPLRVTKAQIQDFFAEVRDFAKAAAGYSVVYKTLFESFNSRQVTATKPFVAKLDANADNWADIKDSEEKRAAYMRNQNACAFITQLVHLAQRYAQVAQHTVNGHTKVLAASAQFTRSLSDKLTKKKA